MEEASLEYAATLLARWEKACNDTKKNIAHIRKR
jgi:hypothetical protein